MAHVAARRALAPCAALWTCVRLGNTNSASLGCCRHVHVCALTKCWSQGISQRRWGRAEASAVFCKGRTSGVDSADARASATSMPRLSQLRLVWAWPHAPSQSKGLSLDRLLYLRTRVFERRLSAAALAPLSSAGSAASAAAVARHTAALSVSPSEAGVEFEEEGKPASTSESAEPTGGEDGGKQNLLLAALLVIVSGSTATILLGDRLWHKEEGPSVSEWLQQLGRNVDAAMSDMHEKMQNAVDDALSRVFPEDTEPLLPDFADLNYPNFLPTLVVDFDGVLAKIEHDRTGGYKIRKRPYSDFFVNQLSHFYEVVVWTDEQPPGVQTAIQQWGLPVTACLSADSMTRFQGKRIKDLGRLGRRLDRVLYMSSSDASIDSRFQDNFIRIKTFSGSDDSGGDEELLHFLDFLKHCSLNPDDVRLSLKRWGGGEDGEVGRRFNSAKQEQQLKAQQRRSIGRFLGMQQSQGPQQLQQMQPPQRNATHF